MSLNRLTRFLALLILAVLPLYYLRFSVSGVPTNIIELLIVLLFILMLWQFRRFRLPNIWPIALTIVGLVLATSSALDRTSALGIVKGWFVVPILYYGCVSMLFNSEEKKVFIYPAIFGLISVSLYAVLQRLGLIGLVAYQLPDAQHYITEGRAIGFFESPNFLAMYLTPLTLLTGGYLVMTKNYRACWWLALPLVAIILSQSRAGLLALAAGIIWLLLLSEGFKANRTRLLAVVVALVALLLALWRGIDDQQRLYIWQKAWQMIVNHPLLGIGPGQFQGNFALMSDSSGRFDAALPYALHPHNLWLNFYLSSGLLGLVGFGGLLIKLGRDFFRSVTRSPLVLAASAALVAVLVHGMFDSTYFKNDLAIIFWLLVFLVGNGYKESNAHRA